MDVGIWQPEAAVIKAVPGEGRLPHHQAPGLRVLGILQQAVHTIHDGTDAALAEVVLIGGEGQVMAQIVLQQVGDDIRSGIGGLFDRIV